MEITWWWVIRSSSPLSTPDNRSVTTSPVLFLSTVWRSCTWLPITSSSICRDVKRSTLSIPKQVGRLISSWSTKKTLRTSWREVTWSGSFTRNKKSSSQWTNIRKSRVSSYDWRPGHQRLLPCPPRPCGRLRWVAEAEADLRPHVCVTGCPARAVPWRGWSLEFSVQIQTFINRSLSGGRGGRGHHYW